QAQVMDLLLEIVRKQNKSLVTITHNLGLVTRYATRVYVMYAGRIIESGTTEQILTNPSHPYTKGLLNSVPKLESDKNEELIPIVGMPPLLSNLPKTCSFLPRCPFACDKCRVSGKPELKDLGDNHFSACYLTEVK
ncbi:MAG: oligopeptide/dipeptide ABC transporter ATP-binding protein, partial [Sphaerochaetaceae bacterium]